MASVRQRRRRHERRVHHVRAQRARLRAALASAPSIFTMSELRRHMGEHGFEPNGLGGWRAQRPQGWVTTGERDLGDGLTEVIMERAQKHRRGPSWSGILTKRAKKRRK